MRERLPGTRLACLYLVGPGVFGDAHQDVRDIEFVVTARALLRGGEQVVDFAVGDHDFVGDLTLTQARHEDFAANILAKLGKRHAVFFQRQTQLRGNHLVFLRDAINRTIQLHIIHAHAVFAGKLHHGAVGDHAFEQLPFKIRTRWRRRTLARQLTGRAVDALVQIVARDHLVVDHGDDAVNGQNGSRLGLRLRLGMASGGD